MSATDEFDCQGTKEPDSSTNETAIGGGHLRVFIVRKLFENQMKDLSTSMTGLFGDHIHQSRVGFGSLGIVLLRHVRVHAGLQTAAPEQNQQICSNLMDLAGKILSMLNCGDHSGSQASGSSE